MWRRKLASLAIAVVGLIVVAAVATSHLVVQAAADVAGSSPYCIEVANDRADYRPARSWFDLSVFRMRAGREGSMYMQHHAVLAVGDARDPSLYRWSYWRLAFEPGVLNERVPERGPAVTCLLIPGFAAALPVLIPQSSESDCVRYSANEAYRIPKSWQAKWNGGTSRTLLLATTAPHFQPLDRRWSDLAPAERDSNWVFVEWNPEWMLNLMKSAPGGDVVEQRTEFGLSSTKTITHGKDGKEYIGYRYLAYAGEQPDGANTTVIGCGANSCQHRFIHNGRHFYFRHRPEHLADWRRMQQRIVDLMASFEVRDTSS